LIFFQFTFIGGSQKKQLEFGPGENLSIGIDFSPQNPGHKTGSLVIRVHGYRNDRGKSVKISIRLHGFADQSFYSFPVEETLSESVMDVTAAAAGSHPMMKRSVPSTAF
jgi:hypothetical protein